MKVELPVDEMEQGHFVNCSLNQAEGQHGISIEIGLKQAPFFLI